MRKGWKLELVREFLVGFEKPRFTSKTVRGWMVDNHPKQAMSATAIGVTLSRHRGELGIELVRSEATGRNAWVRK